MTDKHTKKLRTVESHLKLGTYTSIADLADTYNISEYRVKELLSSLRLRGHLCVRVGDSPKKPAKIVAIQSSSFNKELRDRLEDARLTGELNPPEVWEG